MVDQIVEYARGGITATQVYYYWHSDPYARILTYISGTYVSTIACNIHTSVHTTIYTYTVMLYTTYIQCAYHNIHLYCDIAYYIHTSATSLRNTVK